jgi:hypothetical protein
MAPSRCPRPLVDEVETVVGVREALEHIPVHDVVVGQLVRLARDQVEADHHRTREAPSFRRRATLGSRRPGVVSAPVPSSRPCQWRDDAFMIAPVRARRLLRRPSNGPTTAGGVIALPRTHSSRRDRPDDPFRPKAVTPSGASPTRSFVRCGQQSADAVGLDAFRSSLGCETPKPAGVGVLAWS